MEHKRVLCADGKKAKILMNEDRVRTIIESEQEHLNDMSKANTTHGMTGSRLYGCYKAMMSRCYREKDIHYNAYGKRGITVCEAWRGKPKAFFEWALANGYSDNLTVDRINVNGNYEPSNCRWIPMSEQYRNKQSNATPDAVWR